MPFRCKRWISSAAARSPGSADDLDRALRVPDGSDHRTGHDPMPAAVGDPDNRYQRRSPREGVYLTDQRQFQQRSLNVSNLQSTTAIEERNPARRTDGRHRPMPRIGPVLMRAIFGQRISASGPCKKIRHCRLDKSQWRWAHTVERMRCGVEHDLDNVDSRPFPF
jgi:hypothetical protein